MTIRLCFTLSVFVTAVTAASISRAADLGDDFVLRGALTPQNVGLMNEETELGVRAWVSSGKVEKTLNGPSGSGVGAVSRLRYDGMTGYSGEVYGRVGVAGWSYFKGAASLGAMTTGHLQDEDFPPTLVPYSSTTSAQRKGALDYATLDYGVDLLRDPVYRAGLFLGVNYIREQANAYGCSQTATNPDICFAGEIDPNTLGITQNATWISARLGVSGDVLLFNRLRLGAEAAWVPYDALQARDTHWLRTDIGPVVENGHGQNGAQLEATASYQLTRHFDIGVGVRYWRMTANAKANFVDVSGDFISSEPEKFMTQRFGAFVQAAYRFQ